VEALTAFAHSPNQKTFLMPVETSGIIGALAGIGEIARQTFGGDPPHDARPRRTAASVPAVGQIPLAYPSGAPPQAET
jgi:hypothetical protein